MSKFAARIQRGFHSTARACEDKWDPAIRNGPGPSIRKTLSKLSAVDTQVKIKFIETKGGKPWRLVSDRATGEPMGISMDTIKQRLAQQDYNPIRKIIRDGVKYPHTRQSHGVKRTASELANAALSDIFPPSWLRDACKCSLCIDPSTSQKLFQTHDIPKNVAIKSEIMTDTGREVRWTNDVKGYEEDHVSTYTAAFIRTHTEIPLQRSDDGRIPGTEDIWNKDVISERVKFIDYKEYMESDEVLFEALGDLQKLGLVFIKGIPDNSSAVEDIGGRIGNLRDTFYGRTWDVKSVPNAKNVAYTNQFLGFHMDLLYMSDPPGFQLLHCLKNSCDGGESMFADSFLAVETLKNKMPGDYQDLVKYNVQFHYNNDGRAYRYSHPTIELERLQPNKQTFTKFVNWSPPFQATYHRPGEFDGFLAAAKEFAGIIENPDNIYDYKLNEGECVIFNNRRVLHARKAFDVNSGERWLKGAYLDTDTFWSKYRLIQNTRMDNQVLKSAERNDEDMSQQSGNS